MINLCVSYVRGNQIELFLEPNRVLLWGQLKNPFGILFLKSEVNLLQENFTGMQEM
jgi:hypothetical protein